MNTLKRNYFNVKNESGYTLILTLIALMLIAVISMSLIGLANNSVSVSKKERTDQSVFYIAEAGVTLARAELNTFVPDAVLEAERAVAFADDDLSFDEYDKIYREAFYGYINGAIANKFPTEYNDFDSVNYYEKIKPTTTVTVEKDPTSKDYKIISKATIDDQTRTLENIIYFQLPNDNNDNDIQIDFDNSGANSENTINSGSTSTIYTNDTNLVTLSKPKLNGGAWKSAVIKTIENYDKTNDTVISNLYSEYEYHNKVCKKQINPESDASYELHDPIKAPYKMDIKSKSGVHTVYINGNVDLEKQKFSIDTEKDKIVNIVICGNLNGANGNGSSLIASPSDGVNIFVTGKKSNFNNINIQSNFVFAPEADIVFGGNVDLCTKLFSKSFTGNGGGGGGFTNTCSKPGLIVKPDSPKPPTKDPQQDNNDENTILVSKSLKEID